MDAEEALDNIYIQLFMGLSAIIAVSYYFFFYTTLLGPYSEPSDIYHLLILVATLFIALLLVQIWRTVEDI